MFRMRAIVLLMCIAFVASWQEYKVQTIEDYLVKFPPEPACGNADQVCKKPGNFSTDPYCHCDDYCRLLCRFPGPPLEIDP